MHHDPTVAREMPSPIYQTFSPAPVKRDDLEQAGVVMYDACAPGFFTSEFALKVLGIESVPAGKYFYRLGYGPLALCDGFGVLKTFLTPGMRGTPEYQLLMDARIPNSERECLLVRVEQGATRKGLIQSLDFSATKWFHDRGIKQAVELGASPFASERMLARQARQ